MMNNPKAQHRPTRVPTDNVRDLLGLSVRLDGSGRSRSHCHVILCSLPRASIEPAKSLEKVGLTGLEPVTLRLSSACSNQLSYRPGYAAEPLIWFTIFDLFFGAHLLKSAIANRKSKINGGKGIRTPDFQLAKLALYQLSYAPEKNCGM
jgi:hypothetical protein